MIFIYKWNLVGVFIITINVERVLLCALGIFQITIQISALLNRTDLPLISSISAFFLFHRMLLIIPPFLSLPFFVNHNFIKLYIAHYALINIINMKVFTVFYPFIFALPIAWMQLYVIFFGNNNYRQLSILLIVIGNCRCPENWYYERFQLNSN